MSASSEEQFLEDRTRRDTARSRVEADVERIKSELSTVSLGKRALIRLKEGTTEIYEESSEVVSAHKVLFSALLGGTAILLARKPIMSLFAEDGNDDDRDRDDGDDQYQNDSYGSDEENCSPSSDDEFAEDQARSRDWKSWIPENWLPDRIRQDHEG